jgi:hypothetical protein
MMMTLHPNMTKQDLLRSESMDKLKEQVKQLSQSAMMSNNVNQFKVGPLAECISSVYHQDFFRKDFKIRNIHKGMVIISHIF